MVAPAALLSGHATRGDRSRDPGPSPRAAPSRAALRAARAPGVDRPPAHPYRRAARRSRGLAARPPARARARLLGRPAGPRPRRLDARPALGTPGAEPLRRPA